MLRVSLFVVLTFALASPAGAATTSFDRNGVLHIDGRPSFPIALSRPPALDAPTPWGSNALDEVVEKGVTLVAAGALGNDWSHEALADAELWNQAAAARGIHTWMNLRELGRAQPETDGEAWLRHVVATLGDDPGLALWKGVDEPWHSGWAAPHLAHAYATQRALDPAHLSVLIHAPRGTAEDLRPYLSVGDVMGVDVYPVKLNVRNPNLHWVGRWTHLVRDTTPTRAVTTTLGICFSGSFDRKGGTGAYVVPSRTQMRYMAYDAILNGARGLIFFGGSNTRCMTPGDSALGWNWTYWTSTLRPLVREVGPRGRLYPALTAWEPGPRLKVSNPGTQALARRVGNELWVLAARHGGGERQVTISGLPRGLGRGWVYREGRRIELKGRTLTDTFAQWGVHVYRFRIR